MQISWSFSRNTSLHHLPHQMLPQKLSSLLSNSPTLNHLKQIHALVITNGFFDLENLVARRLLLLSTNSPFSRSIACYIEQVLRFSRNPKASSWGFAIRFFSANGLFRTAFSLFAHMQGVGLKPSSFAFSSSLKACARLGHKLGGFSIHSQFYKMGFRGSVFVQTALLDFYCKTDNLKSALKLFEEMSERNVVSWNSMLSGYVKSNDIKAARKLFDEIPEKDVVSWNSMITGYTKLGDMDRAILLFKQMPEKNSASWNAMISGYTSFGNMDSARNFFEAMPVKNNVSILTMISGYSKCRDVIAARLIFDQMKNREIYVHNAMIACYEQNNHPNEAIELFEKMLKPGSNIHPDEQTLTSILSACSQLGYLEFGLQIESYMKKHKIPIDDHLSYAFIDLYAKCGIIDKAFELFQTLEMKDVVTYSAMITGYALNNRASDAIRLFQEMESANISPNLVTYKALLTAYKHAGLVEEGLECFFLMRDRGLVPSVEHYGIMVDLLGRGGRVGEAHGLIEGMPVRAHAGVWGALLLGCQLHGNVEIGEIAARKCSELRTGHSGHSSLLAGIYAGVERWDDAGRLRGAAEKEKTPGFSWIESS